MSATDATARSVRLPTYVARGGELVYRQPYVGRGARQDIFFVRGDRRRLAEMFTRYFTEPSGGAVEVRPLTGIVAITVLHIDAIHSADPPDSEIGTGIEEHEVAIWTVGLDVRRRRPVFVTPYIFVDSGMAMAAGREVYGLPKQDGRFTISDDGALASLRLDVLATECFAPDARFTWRPVVEIERVGGGKTRPTLWRTFADATRGFSAGLAEHQPERDDTSAPHAGLGGGFFGVIADRVEHLVESAQVLFELAGVVGSGRLPVLALKQFRDAAEPDRACYQAITESNVHVTALHGGGLLGAYTLRVHDLDSMPIVRELGLAEGPLTPLLSGWIGYDFCLEVGTEVWNARAAAAVLGTPRP